MNRLNRAQLVDIGGAVGLSPFEQFKAFTSVLQPKGGNSEIWFKAGHAKFFVGEFDRSGRFKLWATRGTGADRRRSYCVGDTFDYLDRLSRSTDGGVFYIPTQPLGNPLKECVTSTDDIGAELDSGRRDEQRELLAEFNRVTGLQWALHLSSGGKSDHVHLKLDQHYPVEQAQAVRRLVNLALLADPTAVYLHQPMRAPSFHRKEKGTQQSLISSSLARYSPEQVREGLRKWYEHLGWEFPGGIGDVWWNKKFLELLRGASGHTEQYKLDTARALLAAGEAAFLAEKAAQQAARESRATEQRVMLAQRQLTGEVSLVDLVTQTEQRLGANAFNDPKHDWSGSDTKQRGCCSFHESSSGSSAWIAAAENGWTFHCVKCTGNDPISPFRYWLYRRNGLNSPYPRGREWAELAKQFLGEHGVTVPERKLRPVGFTPSTDRPITDPDCPIAQRERQIQKRRLTFRTRYWEALKSDFSLAKADIEYKGYCPIPSLSTSRTHLIQGWLGAGKTEAMLRAIAAQCPDKQIIWLTTRNGLLLQTGNRARPMDLYSQHYQHDVAGNRLLLDAGSSGLITMAVDSLKSYSVGRINWVDVVLVIDEFRSVRSEILGKSNAEIFPEFERALREAGTLIVADAFLSDIDRAILKRYRGRDRIVYRQQFTKSPKRVQWLESTTKDGKTGFAHDGAYFELLDQMIAAGGRHVIAVDNCLTAEVVAAYVTARGKSVKLVCSKTPETNAAFMADPDGVIELEQPDFVIYTPTAQAGLDIQTPFDGGLLIATGTLNPLDMLQMMGRARQCDNWIVSAPRFSGREAIYTDLDGKRVTAWAEQMASQFERLELTTSTDTTAWAQWQNVTCDIEKAFNSEYLECLLHHFFESVEVVTIAGNRTTEYRDAQQRIKGESALRTIKADAANGQRLLSAQRAPQTNQEVYDLAAAKVAANHPDTTKRIQSELTQAERDKDSEAIYHLTEMAKIICGGKTDKLKSYLTLNNPDFYSKQLKRLQAKRFVSYQSPNWKRYTQARLFKELDLEQLAKVQRGDSIEPEKTGFNRHSEIAAKLYQQFRANRDLASLFPFIESQQQFWSLVCRCMSAFGFESVGETIRVAVASPVPNGRDRNGKPRTANTQPTYFSAWLPLAQSGSALYQSLFPSLVAELTAVIELEELLRSDREAKRAAEQTESEHYGAIAA